MICPKWPCAFLDCDLPLKLGESANFSFREAHQFFAYLYRALNLCGHTQQRTTTDNHPIKASTPIKATMNPNATGNTNTVRYLTRLSRWSPCSYSVYRRSIRVSVG